MHGCVLSSMHVYCFQLERFLCRDCGKVKCACDTTSAAANNESATSTAADKPDVSIDENLNKSDSVEYRHPKTVTRQLSGPENSNTPRKPPLSNRASDHPFVRSPSTENGKLRRSFAVRSREGLENLFSFSSVKKGSDQGKSKQINI